MNPNMRKAIERPNCHQGTVPGTPYGILAIITIGELKGIMLAQTAIGPVGSFMAAVINAIDIITSIVTGKANDCASLISSLAALPIAPYNAE